VQGRPDVTLSAQYALRNERIGDLYGLNAAGQPAPLKDRDNILSFGVSIPLLTRRRNLGNIEAAAARVVGSRTLRQHLEATIPLEVKAAWQHWDAAAQSLNILDSGVLRQSEKNLDVIRQAYALGQLRLLDVLNVQRRLIDTQMTYIEAESDVRRGFIELERAVGGDPDQRARSDSAWRRGRRSPGSPANWLRDGDGHGDEFAVQRNEALNMRQFRTRAEFV
jgi:cobalt-zinc-cadmium efflux system outer membrane protein